MVLFMLMFLILTDSAGWLQLAHVPFNFQILKAREGIIFEEVKSSSPYYSYHASYAFKSFTASSHFHKYGCVRVVMVL